MNVEAFELQNEAIVTALSKNIRNAPKPQEQVIASPIRSIQFNELGPEELFAGTRPFLLIIMKRYGKKSSESPPRIRALIVKPNSDHLKHT